MEIMPSHLTALLQNLVLTPQAPSWRGHGAACLGGDLKLEASAEEKINSLHVQKLKIESKRRCVKAGEGHCNPKFLRSLPWAGVRGT